MVCICFLYIVYKSRFTTSLWERDKRMLASKAMLMVYIMMVDGWKSFKNVILWLMFYHYFIYSTVKLDAGRNQAEVARRNKRDKTLQIKIFCKSFINYWGILASPLLENPGFSVMYKIFCFIAEGIFCNFRLVLQLHQVWRQWCCNLI